MNDFDTWFHIATAAVCATVAGLMIWGIVSLITTTGHCQ